MWDQIECNSKVPISSELLQDHGDMDILEGFKPKFEHYTIVDS